MTTRTVTPSLLRERLAGVLPPSARVVGIRYVTERGRGCLRAGVFRYPALRMDQAELEEWAAAIAQLPGVVRTETVTGHRSLRDQVIVVHRRIWDEQ